MPQWHSLLDRLMSVPEGVYEERNSSGSYNNRNPWGKQYGEDGVAWCVIFDWCMYSDVGLASIVPKVNNVSVFTNWAKQRGQWSDYPSVGAWVNFSNGGHTEIVTGFDATYVYTKGGNTIPTGAADSGQGYGVYSHKTERRAARVVGYFAPRFPDGLCPPTADPNDPRGGAKLTSWRYGDALPYGQADSNANAPWVSGRQVIWAANNTIANQRRVAPGNDHPGDDVENVQKALGVVNGFTTDTPGLFTPAMGAAYAAWQRSLGFTGDDANGVPGEYSLTELGKRSGLFRARDFAGAYVPKYVDDTPPAPAERPWISFKQVEWAARNSIDAERAQPPGPANSQDDVLLVQDALAATVGLGADANRGFFDGATGDAYRKWQESLGYRGADADSIPGPDSLTRLGDKTGFFRVNDFPTGAGTSGGVSSAGKIDPREVTYFRYEGTVSSDVFRKACEAAGVTYTSFWEKGYRTAASRESGGNANACNVWDSNAVTPTGYSSVRDYGDGYSRTGVSKLDGKLTPFQCSRGLVQCIPQTFAAYHAPGTSTNIYDPVASVAASIRYVRDRYGVAADGSDLASRVQQFDPNRPPKGY